MRQALLLLSLTDKENEAQGGIYSLANDGMTVSDPEPVLCMYSAILKVAVKPENWKSPEQVTLPSPSWRQDHAWTEYLGTCTLPKTSPQPVSSWCTLTHIAGVTAQTAPLREAFLISPGELTPSSVVPLNFLKFHLWSLHVTPRVCFSRQCVWKWRTWVLKLTVWVQMLDLSPLASDLWGALLPWESNDFLRPERWYLLWMT